MKTFTEKQTQQEERWRISEERRQTWNAQAKKERQMFLKSLQDGGSNFGSETTAKVVKNTVKEPTMQKLSENDDIENYMTTFERVSTSFKWPSEVWSLKLAPYLTGKAQAAFATMDKDQTHRYESVKTAILKRYNINEETYGQRFVQREKYLRRAMWNWKFDFATLLTNGRSLKNAHLKSWPVPWLWSN